MMPAQGQVSEILLLWAQRREWLMPTAAPRMARSMHVGGSSPSISTFVGSATVLLCCHLLLLPLVAAAAVSCRCACLRRRLF